MAFLQRVVSIALFTAALVMTASACIDCISGNFDAMAKTSDGNYYAFRGDHVLKLSDGGNGVADGYPKLISEVFRGLPSSLDAAVYWRNTKTYFFKGDVYWRFSGTRMDPGYPIKISRGFRGLPNDLDAAMPWAGNRVAYFVKGSQYWRYNVANDRADPGYPKEISESTWGGYSGPSFGAATIWSNGWGYIFDGEQYWRYDTVSDRVISGYPLSTTREWLGCPNTSPNIDMAGNELFAY